MQGFLICPRLFSVYVSAISEGEIHMFADDTIFFCTDTNIEPLIPGESKRCPAFERLLLPKYICNNILQYLIELPNRSIIFRNFSD